MIRENYPLGAFVTNLEIHIIKSIDYKRTISPIQGAGPKTDMRELTVNKF